MNARRRGVTVGRYVWSFALAVVVLLVVLVSTATAPVSHGAALTTPSPAASPTGERRWPIIAGAGRVVTDTLWAQSLGIRKALTVYLPPSYDSLTSRRYPVLYYLHGLYGAERDWIDAGRIDKTLDSLFASGMPEAIVIMPDGDDGWYTTWNTLPDLAACRADRVRKEAAETYCVPWPHYDDYIARDVVKFVDGRYRTMASAARRGIGGLSMGGLGAISLALAYPDVFSAAASHSGVVSPRLLGPKPYAPPAQYANSYAEMQVAAGGLWRFLLPAFGRDTIGWAAREPRQLLARLQKVGTPVPRLYLDCGVDDTYIGQNRDLHETLQRRGVSHQYAEYPGAHNWTYWRSHVGQSAAFLLSAVGER
ncbi:MAG: esterase family protein [Gemmatimonadaceae bacterium]|nr:esterase family protein [Gemmatimonadaceae bacterium]